MLQHLGNLLGHEGNGPLENIHKVGQKVWMLILKELLYVESVILRGKGFTLNLMTAPLLL